MSIAYDFITFLDRVTKEGARALDPNLISHYRRRARQAWDGTQVAIQAPVASDTWELKLLLPKADAQSQQQITFPRPLAIVGIYPTVTLTGAAAPGDIVPTLDDLEVYISAESERQFTQGQPNTGGSAFVTLTSMKSGYPGPGRLFQRKLTSATPTLSVIVRGKRGVGVYADADVRLSFFADYLKPEERVESAQ